VLKGDRNKTDEIACKNEITWHCGIQCIGNMAIGRKGPASEIWYWRTIPVMITKQKNRRE
jgi:hypothetical protein